MNAVEKSQFLHNYSKVLVQAWTDPTFASNLDQQTVATLRANGIGTVEGAKVSIVKDAAGPANVDSQIEAWDKGNESGNYTLYIPSAPKFGVQSGSASAVGSGTTVCCCCCPCCTST